MKSLTRIIPLLLLLGTTAVLLAGCGGYDSYYYHDDYFITIINDSPWDIFIEPFGVLLAPGDTVDFEVGYDIVHIIAWRDFDGLILAELDMAEGEVLVVE